MVDLKVTELKIGGNSFNKDKSGYPALPTVYSGVDIQWGAGSCIEHPDPSRAQISLWIPKTHEDWIPALGDVVSIKGGHVQAGITQSKSLFAGKVESVKLQDDHKDAEPGIPNSKSMTNLTGWTVKWKPTTGSYTDITGTVTITDGKTLNVPYPGAIGTWQTFSVTAPSTQVVGGRRYRFDYITSQIFESVEASWYDASSVLITTGSFSNQNNTTSLTAPLGATSVRLTLIVGIDRPATGNFLVGSFALLSSNPPGYRVNIVAADALAEASRLRLSDTPWLNESLINRQVRIADLASKAGVAFNAGLTEEQGYYEALDTEVRPRDVDSFPALELFQRTTMSAGHTVVSVDNVVQPSTSLNLPAVLGIDATGVTTTYQWTGVAGKSKSTKKVNGVVTRTNEASNPSGGDWTTNYLVNAGSGGSASLGTVGTDTRNGTNAIRAYWSVAPTGGAGVQGIAYKDNAVSGASASKVSAGAWVKVSIDRGVRLVVNLFNGVNPAGTATSATVNLKANQWTYVKLDSVTATSAYTSVEVSLQVQIAMILGAMMYVDGVLIEKVAAGGPFFDGDTLDVAANVIPVEIPGIPVFDTSNLMDDTFELDTSQVVNEIKIEMTKFVGSAGPPGWEQDANEDFDQIFTNEAGSKKTTPQTRSIATDWSVRDAFADDIMATSVMVTKGKLLLAGQSNAQWRLSSGVTPVLSELPEQAALGTLLDESTRFGALIRIDNAPALLPQYMRIRGGRIVLGDNPHLEFEVEPVEYSAPIPLSKRTLTVDDVASNYRIGNFHTLTSNDLRAIGAR